MLGPRPGEPLAELRRAIRPGGELRFYEHVDAARQPGRGLLHFAQATFWPRAFGNCHPARDTSAAIRSAGFAMERCRAIPFDRRQPESALPHILGAARRP